MLMGFLPFGVNFLHLYMAAISWPLWPGYVKGLEISLMDVLALALYFSLPRDNHRLPFRFSMAFYFAAVVLSVLQSPVPVASIFYVWQLARMFLVYAVVTKACRDERVPMALLAGMTLGLCMEAGDSIWERFVLGVLQAGGTVGHQNFLGLMSHFVVFPCFALLLAGQRGWQPLAGPIAGLVVAILTVSRATVGLAAIGYVQLFVLSAWRRWTGRKARVLACALAIACLATPIVLFSFEKRFSGENEAQGGYDERAAFERAASMMISDHPMGVSPNYYVVAANTDGYNARARVAWVIGSDSANVHNVYYLVTAESGYIGLLAFIVLMLRPLIVAFRCGWKARSDRQGDLLLGLATSLLIVYIHNYFEWIFVSFQAQYMFALDVGLVAEIAVRLGYWRRNPQAHSVAQLQNAIAKKV